MDGIMATITCFAGDFAPKNWAFCNGQLISIAQNQALYSLLGTTYGGDGNSTFALPDLRGRRPVSAGQGSGFSNYNLGQQVGAEGIVLNVNNLPKHDHSGTVILQIDADSSEGSVTRSVNTYPALLTNGYAPPPVPPPNPPIQMLSPKYAATIAAVGSEQPIPVPVLMPYLVVNYVICMYGIFPSRN
jgi:microcystin-dependent protein